MMLYGVLFRHKPLHKGPAAVVLYVKGLLQAFRERHMERQACEVCSSQRKIKLFFTPMINGATSANVLFVIY